MISSPLIIDFLVSAQVGRRIDWLSRGFEENSDQPRFWKLFLYHCGPFDTDFESKHIIESNKNDVSPIKKETFIQYFFFQSIMVYQYSSKVLFYFSTFTFSNLVKFPSVNEPQTVKSPLAQNPSKIHKKINRLQFLAHGSKKTCRLRISTSFFLIVSRKNLKHFFCQKW